MVQLKDKPKETAMSIEKLGPREKGRKNKGRPAPARIRQLKKAARRFNRNLRGPKQSPFVC